jgi:Na+-translocating ferredoxin:NAD+ oxidoreductase RnfD subunit
LVCYIGLPVVCARREHITIGILDKLFRGAVKRIQQTIINLLLGILTLIWAREVWIQADALAASGELLMFLRLPVAPAVYVMGVLTFLAAGTLFALAWFVARGDISAPTATEPR